MKREVEFDLTKTDSEVTLSVKCDSKEMLDQFEKVFGSILQDLTKKIQVAVKE